MAEKLRHKLDLNKLLTHHQGKINGNSRCHFEWLCTILCLQQFWFIHQLLRVMNLPNMNTNITLRDIVGRLFGRQNIAIHCDNPLSDMVTRELGSNELRIS